MKSTLNYLTWSFALLLVAACGQKKTCCAGECIG